MSSRILRSWYARSGSCVGSTSLPARRKAAPALAPALRVRSIWRGDCCRTLCTGAASGSHVVLPDGTALDMETAGPWTGVDVANKLSPSLAKAALAMKINGRLLDLSSPVHQGDTVHFAKWSEDDDDIKQVFWHSSSHILGAAVQRVFGNSALLGNGPAVEEGFYYDVAFGGSESLDEHAQQEINQAIRAIVAEDIPFERKVVSRDEARDIFAHNRFKLKYIDRIPEDVAIGLYRLGDFVDLCAGPHIQRTGQVKAIKTTTTSAAHSDVDNSVLQRIYGISFPSKKLLSEYEKRREEARKRDHRLIGANQKLFLFDQASPGSPFFLPHGTRIYNKLVQFIRSKLALRGYEEIITPQVFDQSLWKTSGHWDKYRDDMYTVDDGSETWNSGLKPMNCPGHCQLFSVSGYRSYRDLPVRWAEFGSLHRNEASGALTGLTRARRFAQDDAHIFCTREQMHEEIADCLRLIDEVYQRFGFGYSLALSTRPESAVGDTALWNDAESQLRSTLDAFCNETGRVWKLNEGDGAFYGPKIDVRVTDAIGRRHQCATVQLDFNLPARFGLRYRTSAGDDATPVMIHRAILGSMERMMAILTEHYAGRWPMWLSPRQCAILPVSAAFASQAELAVADLRTKEFYADVLAESETLSKRLRRAQVEQYNLIGVIGEREASRGTVNVRRREGEQLGELSIGELAELMRAET